MKNANLARCVPAAVASLILVIGSTTAMAQSHTTRPIVLGYYPSWKSGLEPASINYSQFTHLCHAFVTADTSGTVKCDGNLPSRELAEWAHATGAKVLLSLGGMDSGNYFGPMMRSPEARERFVTAVTKMVVDYGYDGVDLDWEFPKGEEDMANFVVMAKRFRETLDVARPGSLITSALSGVQWAGRWIDADGLAPYVDFINVMTYDMHGPWGDHAGFNSTLHHDPRDRAACTSNTMENQMAYWVRAKNWPKSKLVVGIPCYGRGFAVAKWYEATTPTQKAAHPYLAFRDVAKLLKQGWKSQWDADAGQPCLSRDGVRELIGYDDERTAAAKGRWAAETGYAGVFFWEISQDFVDGRHALVGAASQGYRKGLAARGTDHER